MSIGVIVIIIVASTTVAVHAVYTSIGGIGAAVVIIAIVVIVSIVIIAEYSEIIIKVSEIFLLLQCGCVRVRVEKYYCKDKKTVYVENSHIQYIVIILKHNLCSRRDNTHIQATVRQ